jgi:prepilin-type processing-associated H-X9-DG protein
MRGTKGSYHTNAALVAAIIVVTGAVVWPALFRCRCGNSHPNWASHCQSNMNTLGKAFKMYLADWDNTFPTNRLKRAPGAVASCVPLSDPGEKGRDGKRIRFQYGVNWVEGIYPYVEKISESEDADDSLICPAAWKWRQGSHNARVTYAFNANKVEMPEGMIMNAGNLIMCRELDRRYDAVLRPTNRSSDEKDPPKDAFLDPTDETNLERFECKLHGDGSAVLFPDGHVKHYSVAYFPRDCQWDKESRQWYNLVRAPGADPIRKSLAVSP